MTKNLFLSTLYMSDTLNSTLHLKSFIFLLLKELEAFLFLFLFLSLLFIFIFKDFWSIAFSYVKIIIYCQRNVLFSSFCLKFTLITELIFSAEQTTFVDLTWFANASLGKKISNENNFFVLWFFVPLQKRIIPAIS